MHTTVILIIDSYRVHLYLSYEMVTEVVRGIYSGDSTVSTDYISVRH